MMMIDSKVLRQRLNDRSVIPWHENDRSVNGYKQGYLNGLLKALAILGDVEYFTEHGKDREPIDFELSDDAIKGLTAVTEAVADKIKELEITEEE